MRDTRPIQQSQFSSTPATASIRTLELEDIFIRNYDHAMGYDLDLVVADSNGSAVFENHYYQPPGSVSSETDSIPAGEYEVHALLDNEKGASVECEIGDGLHETLLVEIGNGVISLSQGIHR